MKDSTRSGPNTRLRRERERLCWSQEEVAEKVGTTALNVSRWERGVTFPNPHFRRQLCALFGKTPVQLGLVKDGDAEDEPPAAEPLRQGTAAANPLGPSQMPAAMPSLAMPSLAMPPLLAVPTLVGRDELLDSLRQVLVRGRLPLAIALSGLPGAGKTALAIAISGDSEVISWYDGGILWAGLGPAPNILGLLSAWGTALGIAAPEAGRLANADEWATMLHAAIATRRMLLVIDDVWQLEDALAFKVGGPNCTHLLTTRYNDIALRFGGDHAIQVDELGAADGMSLLAELAPEVIDTEPAAAREIVASVGGLPLALVLMGKYLHVQAHSGQPRRVRGALERLRHAEERLRLTEPQASLERPPGLPPGTPLSLQAVIEISDHRLDPEASAALRALSVFPAKPNCFSEEAAVATTGRPAEVLDTLVDAGVLEPCGPGRYTLHQTVADFARLSRPASTAEAGMVAYYVALVQMSAPRTAELDAESLNILAALEYAHELELRRALVAGACGVAPFLLARGLYSVAELHLYRAQQAALLLDDAEAQALVALHLGRVAELRGDLTRAEELYQQGLAVAPTGGDPASVARLLAYWGEAAVNRGGHERAMQFLVAAMPLARAAHDRACEALLLRLLGEAADCAGDRARAQQQYRAGLDIARELADQEQIGALLQNLGEGAMRDGDYDQAEALFQEGLVAAQQLAHQQRISALLSDLGALALRRHRYDDARALLAESIALARNLGHKIRLCTALLHMGQTAVEQGDESDAERYLGESLDLARGMGYPYLLGDGLCAWASLCLRRGQLDAAARACVEAVAVARTLHDRDIIGVAAFRLAQVAHASERLGQARRYAQHSLRYLARDRRELAPEVQRFLDALPPAVREAPRRRLAVARAARAHHNGR